MIQPSTACDPKFKGIDLQLNLGELREEQLAFTVRLVRDQDDLDKAIEVRHAAYARHLPEFAKTLTVPESSDRGADVVVLLAESKLDGSPLGTMRIQNNRFNPLCLEQSVALPEWLKTGRLAEATRLGVAQGRDSRLVTTVLFKAFFKYCQQTDVEWMVIAGRAPVDRQYDRLLFQDVFPGLGYIALRHASDLPHRVLSFHIDSAQERWARAQHPLFEFMFDVHHPDIQIGEPLEIAHRPMHLGPLQSRAVSRVM
jgi:hypothetical protein